MLGSKKRTHCFRNSFACNETERGGRLWNVRLSSHQCLHSPRELHFRASRSDKVLLSLTMTSPVRLCETFSREGGTTYRDSTENYLDFSPFSRSFYVIDRNTSKRQSLSFPRKIVASLSPLVLSSISHLPKKLGRSSLPSSSPAG
jgi:hypothetical protein